MTPTPLRWAIAIIDLDPTVGHEQAGERQALVAAITGRGPLGGSPMPNGTTEGAVWRGPP